MMLLFYAHADEAFEFSVLRSKYNNLPDSGNTNCCERHSVSNWIGLLYLKKSKMLCNYTLSKDSQCQVSTVHLTC